MANYIAAADVHYSAIEFNQMAYKIGFVSYMSDSRLSGIQYHLTYIPEEEKGRHGNFIKTALALV